MPSLTHEIINCKKLETARAYNRQHQKLKDNAKKGNRKAPTQRMPTNKSVKQYTNHAIKFGKWCRDTFGARHFEDCAQYVQAYSDYLVSAGKKEGTIHTYLASICFVFDVPLSSIKKPIRHTANNTKSRGKKKSDSRKDTQRGCSPRLYDFAGIICVRRHDYVALRQNDLTTDETGHLCVVIRKGKGGKYQLQRVPYGYEDFIRSFFDGSDNFVFTKKEVTNKQDLHHLRHLAALREYRYYEHRLANEPEYRDQLIAEIKARWVDYNDRLLKDNEMRGKYIMRGKNRELAVRLGFQYSFDRLAVLATSIFHLAHWRNNVTVCNYIMAALADEAMNADDA